jgi:hypothetical protein
MYRCTITSMADALYEEPFVSIISPLIATMSPGKDSISPELAIISPW